jgi:hypothetical protein
MSNRSLLEFNHDYAGTIKRDPEGFLRAIEMYLNSACDDTASPLRHYGVTVKHMRHHSGPCPVDEYKAQQKKHEKRLKK